MDAFWYIYTSELYYDEATADRLNEKVWGKIPALAARDLLPRFNLQERGLEGLVKPLPYWPPPDPHPRDMFCQWRFCLASGDVASSRAP
jgi:hypothetical protein